MPSILSTPPSSVVPPQVAPAPSPRPALQPEEPKEGFAAQIVALAHFLARTEVHTYAFYTLRLARQAQAQA